MNKQEQELRKKSPVQIKNKKASFEYFFVDTYTAGIVLTELKSRASARARPRWWIPTAISTTAKYG